MVNGSERKQFSERIRICMFRKTGVGIGLSWKPGTEWLVLQLNGKEIENVETGGKNSFGYFVLILFCFQLFPL